MSSLSLSLSPSQLSIARVGSTVNFLVVGPLYHLIEGGGGGGETPGQTEPQKEPHTALGLTLLIVGSTCVLSLLCAVVLGFMDRRRDKLLRKSISKNEETVSLGDILTFPLSFWLLSVVCLAYYVAVFPFISLGQVNYHLAQDLQGDPSGQLQPPVDLVPTVLAACGPLL